jgi:hypothetical protein
MCKAPLHETAERILPIASRYGISYHRVENEFVRLQHYKSHNSTNMKEQMKASWLSKYSSYVSNVLEDKAKESIQHRAIHILLCLVKKGK